LSIETSTQPDAFTRYQEQRRFNALDGVRAVAVLLVVTWHVRGGELSDLNGDFGVSAFFILSGYLITTLAVREEARTGRFSYAGFMIRRIFRIWPLLWLGVGVYSVAIYGFHLDNRVHAFTKAIPYYLFYFPEVPSFSVPPTSMHGEGPVPFSGVWSLGIEEKFYLVWPIVAFAILKNRRGRGWLALALSAVFYLVQEFGTRFEAKYLYAYAPIALGAALAFCLQNRRGFEFFRRAVPAWLAAVVLLGSIYLNHYRPGVPGTVVHEVLVAALIGYVVVNPTSIGARMMSNAMLRRIGELSYGLYLFHVLGLKVADKLLPSGQTLPLAFAEMAIGLPLAYVGCELLHRYFEGPAQDFGRRLAQRVSRRTASSVGTAPITTAATPVVSVPTATATAATELP
jgi:peptidoglycan/LPS O-acetylase OafA/YrhL